MQYLRIGQVAKMTGISRSSLRRYDNAGILQSDYRIPGGHRRYFYKKILTFLGKGVDYSASKQVMIYARVSAIRQKEDLKRQIDCLHDYANNRGWGIIKTYSDIASGINDDRKNMLRMISDIPVKQPDYILCTYRDRVARFGTGILEQFCDFYGTKLMEIKVSEITEEEELMHSFIAILTSFIGKFYRKRRSSSQTPTT